MEINPLSNLNQNVSTANTYKTLNARSKADLVILLRQVCALQKAYGKTAEELEILVEGFAWLLAEFNMYEIKDAFKKYILNHNDIPTPHDILEIIKTARIPQVGEPTIEKLLHYRASGINLSIRDKQRLEIAGHNVDKEE